MLNVAAFGRGHFAFELDAESIYAAEITAKSDEEQFIAWQRRDKLVSGIIQRVNKTYRVQDGKIRSKVQVSGKLAGVMAWFPVMQPDSGADKVEFTGKVDDAMKDHARHQMVVGTAYDDPDSNPRGYAGVSVAANKTEHPDTKTLTRSGACLGDELLKWGVEYDVDWDLETTWAVDGLSWQFQTWYQGRGSDLTISNGDGNVPVILSDIYEVVGEASCYIDRYDFRTHGYNEDLSGIVARSGASGFMRREVVVKAALQRYDQTVGRIFLFIESEGVQVGRDFWVYDRITHGVRRLDTDYEDDYVAEIEFSYDPKGNETIKLVLGDPKPDLSKAPGSRRADTETEEPWSGGFWRRHIATNTLYPAYSADGSPDHVVTIWGGNIRAYSGNRTGLTFQVSGATGNTVWADAAQMTWESIAYRMPVDAPTTGEVLRITTGTPNQLSWDAATTFAVTTVTAGTGLTGGGGPGAITINAVGGTGLTATADAINLDNTAVTPGSYGDATHVGQFTVDQQGRLTAAANIAISGVPPAAHNILSASHGDTLAAGVSRGSLIVGNATPKWAKLTVGAASTHLESDGTDVTWQTNITMADGAMIRCAGAPVMTFDDTNNILHVTGAHLRVGYDTDLTSYLGRAAVGFDGAFGDQASFAHIDHNHWQRYALSQHSTGYTNVNAGAGMSIYFKIDAISRMAMDATATRLYRGQSLWPHRLRRRLQRGRGSRRWARTHR